VIYSDIIGFQHNLERFHTGKEGEEEKKRRKIQKQKKSD
jgi:hypothetical protein